MKNKSVIIIFLELIISVGAISSDSFWTDEGIRLHAVVFGKLNEVIAYGIADKQLFFVLKQYLWTGLFGVSEVSARSLNLLFAMVTIYFLNKILACLEIDKGYGLLLFISPMFVYYMNDAGPYIMLLAYSIGFLYYLSFKGAFSSLANTVMINVIFLLGVGTHFIFGFIYVMYLVKLCQLAFSKELAIKAHLYIGLLFSPIYLTLLSLYLQAVESGLARGWAPPNMLNVLFVGYSFIGTTGLSLSRNEIRAGQFDSLNGQQVILPIMLGLVVLSLLWLGPRGKPHPLKGIRLGTVSYLVVFFVFAYHWHFHFWERHVMMAYAVFMIRLIETISQLIAIKKGQILLGLLISLFLFSSVQLRFHPYYGKDNYKEAIAYALNAQKTVILYQGDWKVSNYYGIQALPYDDYQQQIEGVDDKGRVYVIDIRDKQVKEIDAIVNHYAKEEVMMIFNEKYDKFSSAKVYEQRTNYKKRDYNTFSIFE